MKAPVCGFLAALWCLAIAAHAVEFTIDCNNKGTTVSRNLYGMNVARWDRQLFRTIETQMLIECDRDAIKKLKDLRPAFLKYPGGNDADSYVWNSPRNDPRDMNTTEFLHLAQVCEAPGFLTVNFNQSPQLAADWVRFVNAPGSPARVPMWEVGDEVWGSWASSHTSGTMYGAKFRVFANAMRAADPTIRLAANLPLTAPETSWTQEALMVLGEDYDIVTITYFPLNPPNENDVDLLAAADRYRYLFRRLSMAVEKFRRERRPEFCLVGFNSTSTRPGPQTTEMVNAVFMAQMFGAMAETGTDMACWWAFHNEYPKRKGDYGVLASNEKNTPYFTYWVLKMLSEKFHGRLVLTARANDVECYGVMRENGAMSVLLVNTSPKAWREVSLGIAGAKDRNWKTATVDRVESSSLAIDRKAEWHSANVLQSSGPETLRFDLPGALPPYSVTLATFEPEARSAAELTHNTGARASSTGMNPARALPFLLPPATPRK